jgi:hypothetical protein
MDMRNAVRDVLANLLSHALGGGIRCFSHVDVPSVFAGADRFLPGHFSTSGRVVTS